MYEVIVYKTAYDISVDIRDLTLYDVLETDIEEGFLTVYFKDHTILLPNNFCYMIRKIKSEE